MNEKLENKILDVVLGPRKIPDAEKIYNPGNMRHQHKLTTAEWDPADGEQVIFLPDNYHAQFSTRVKCTCGLDFIDSKVSLY